MICVLKSYKIFSLIYDDVSDDSKNNKKKTVQQVGTRDEVRKMMTTCTTIHNFVKL